MLQQISGATRGKSADRGMTKAIMAGMGRDFHR
jgi:hypothetical protein